MLLVKNICKSFKRKAAIIDINIAINKGEIVGLLGPNGAGKSTLFSIISGILKPDSGSILLNNMDITYIPIHKRAQIGIVYLPQENSIFKGLNVIDNILSIIELYEKNKKIQIIRASSILNEFSLFKLSKNQSITLSGGEKRRLEIARCLAANPSYLLFDEPFAGIDPISIEEIKNIILKLKTQNLGILISDHNAREILDILDTGYVIHNGKILISGTKETIAQSNDAKKLYLGEKFTIN